MVGGSVEIIARDVPGDIMAALVNDARDRDVTMQEAAVGVLAGKFRVKRRPSTRKFIAGTQGRDTLILSVPLELRDQIHKRAFHERGTMRGVMLSALSSHYGLSVVSLARRQRGRTE